VDVPVGGEAVTAPVGLLSGGIAVVEAATTCGVGSDLAGASTAAVGEAIDRAPTLREGIRSVVVATGDSGAVDGGSGAARAAGYRFLDRRGRDLPSGGRALRDLARIDPGRVRIDETVPIVAACDSGEPLLGPFGAARAGDAGSLPQAEIEELDEGLAVLAQRISADLGREVA
jgi:glycerate 2-kinase